MPFGVVTAVTVIPFSFFLFFSFFHFFFFQILAAGNIYLSDTLSNIRTPQIYRFILFFLLLFVVCRAMNNEHILNAKNTQFGSCRQKMCHQFFVQCARRTHVHTRMWRHRSANSNRRKRSSNSSSSSHTKSSNKNHTFYVFHQWHGRIIGKTAQAELTITWHRMKIRVQNLRISTTFFFISNAFFFNSSTNRPGLFCTTRRRICVRVTEIHKILRDTIGTLRRMK